MPTFDCDAILFDLDGVLVDSSAVIRRHWQRWAQQHGLDFAAIMQVAHGYRTVETMRIVAPHLDVEAEARRMDQSEAADLDGVQAIAGAGALLQALPPDAWAIATSGPRPLATARLAHAGLPIPHILVTADDVRRGKPDPEPYLAAARGLCLAQEQCLVVEDAPAGLEAARAAGMRAIAVASTHPAAELARASAIVTRLSDLTIVPGARSRLIVRFHPPPIEG